MLKSEEHTLEVMASDLHEVRRLRHAAEKGKCEAERCANMLAKEGKEVMVNLLANRWQPILHLAKLNLN